FRIVPIDESDRPVLVTDETRNGGVDIDQQRLDPAEGRGARGVRYVGGGAVLTRPFVEQATYIGDFGCISLIQQRPGLARKLGFAELVRAVGDRILQKMRIR